MCCAFHASVVDVHGDRRLCGPCISSADFLYCHCEDVVDESSSGGVHVSRCLLTSPILTMVPNATFNSVFAGLRCIEVMAQRRLLK